MSVKYFSKIEDDGHIEEFLNKYTAPVGMGREEILFERYWARGQRDKYELMRQLRLYELIDGLTAGASMQLWGRDDSKNADRRLAENTARLQILHAFCRETPSEIQPVSCGKEVDMWAETRIMLGLRQAEALAELRRVDEAYIFLEDAVILLERIMEVNAIKPEEFLPNMIWTAEEAWHNPDNDPTKKDIGEILRKLCEKK